MSLALLFHYLLLNMFRMLMHSPQELGTYLMSYFMGCIVLVRCVLVLCCGLAGVVWYPYTGFSHTTPVKPQRNTNTHRTRTIQPMK